MKQDCMTTRHHLGQLKAQSIKNNKNPIRQVADRVLISSPCSMLHADPGGITALQKTGHKK
jgi:hypothetical protein